MYYNAFICPKCADITVDETETIGEATKKLKEEHICHYCDTPMVSAGLYIIKEALKVESTFFREFYCYKNPLYDEELDKKLHADFFEQTTENEETTKNEENQTEQTPSPKPSEFDNTTWFSIFTYGSLIGGFIVFYQLAIKRDHAFGGVFLSIMILLLGRYLCARLAPNTSKFIDEQIKEDRNSKNNRRCNPGLKCPLCGSHYVVKIGSLDRAASVHFWGLASDKIGKQYECKDCRHKF